MSKQSTPPDIARALRIRRDDFTFHFILLGCLFTLISLNTDNEWEYRMITINVIHIATLMKFFKKIIKISITNDYVLLIRNS